MGNPLESILGGPTPAAPTGNPLEGILTSQGAATATATNPLEQIVGPSGPVGNLDTALGRRDEEAANRAQNIAKLQRLLERSDISPAQRQRVERMIEQFDDPLLYNRKTEDRRLGSNLLRGAATGVVSEGLLGAADLAASAGQFLGAGADALLGTETAEFFKDFRRENIMEAQELVKQAFRPEGVEGSIGRVAGALGGGAPVYGKLGALATARLARMPGYIGRAAELGARGNIWQRAVTNAAAGMPIDALQALTLPETEAVTIALNKQKEGLPLDEADENALDDHSARQLLTLGIGVGAGGLGGAVIEALPPAAQIAVGKIRAFRGISQADAAKSADELAAAGALAMQTKRARQAASTAWNRGNQEVRRKLLGNLTDDEYVVMYKDLKPEQKQRLLEAFGAPSNSNLNTSPSAGATAAQGVPPAAGSPTAPATAPPSTPGTPPSPGPKAPPPAASPTAGSVGGTPVTPLVPRGAAEASGTGGVPSAGRASIASAWDSNDPAARQAVFGLDDITSRKKYSELTDEQKAQVEAALIADRPLAPITQQPKLKVETGGKPSGYGRFDSSLTEFRRIGGAGNTHAEGDVTVTGNIIKDKVPLDVAERELRAVGMPEDRIKKILTQAKDNPKTADEPDVELPTQNEIDSELATVLAQLEEVKKQNLELEKRANLAERAAEIDGLTGIPNQAAFNKALPAIENNPDEEILLLDVMQLKALNDTQGQAAGDEMLRELGNVLSQFRSFRVGGDEFAIVVKKGNGPEFLRVVQTEFGLRDIPGTPYKVGVRGGSGQTFDEASSALVRAKESETGPKARVVEKIPTTNEKPTEVGPNTRPEGITPQETFKAEEAVAEPAAVVQAEIRPLTVEEMRDAGLMESEIARGVSTTMVPLGNAYYEGQLRPITPATYKKILQDLKGNLTHWRKKYEIVQGLNENEPVSASTVTRIFGSDSRVGNSKSEMLAAIERRRDDIKREMDRYGRVHERWKANRPPPKTRKPKAKTAEPAAPAEGPRTIEKIDEEIDALDELHDAGKINDGIYTARLQALAEEKQAIKGASKAAAPSRPSLKIKLPDTVGKNLKDFEPDVLLNVQRSIRSTLGTVAKGSEEERILLEEFKRVAEYRAGLDGGLGTTVHMHPSVGGAVAGAVLGFTFADEEDRYRQAILFGALGAGGGIYMSRRWGPGVTANKPNLTPWEAKVAEQVLNTDQLGKKTPLMDRMRMQWHAMKAGVIRRSYQVERAQDALGGDNLPTMQNAARQFMMFGRWRAQAESWLMDGPSHVGLDGNVTWTGALPLQKVAQMVNGDTDALGRVMASFRSLELYAKGVTTGIDPAAANAVAKNATQEQLDAMGAARQYASALADAMDQASLLLDRAKMADMFYAPLNRIFGSEVPTSAQLQTITKNVKSKIIGGANPAKNLKGGKQKILNPFEALVDNTARVLRSAELNRIGVAFADLLDAADPALAKMIGQRLHGSDLKEVPGYAAKVKALQIEMQKVGTKTGQDEAEMIINTMSDEALNVSDDILRIWRNGKIEQWRLNPAMAEAFRSLNPGELDMLFQVVGLPSMVARVGITNNPVFVARQAFRDIWQATLNSQHGFIPVLDNMRGWFHGIARTKEYKEYLAAGGGYGALAEQRFAYGATALPDVKRAPVTNTLEKAAQEARELKITSAYQTIVNPIIEAARVGEYLRARGAGKPAIDAVFAAKHVTGNYENIGTKMRGIGHIALFLNPAIRALDASISSFTRDPVAYTVKAFVGIALPSYYFWHTYQDDPELDQLRRTETGRRYWWARSTEDGTIIKIPKPIADGQIWGSTVETALDKMKLQDPTSVELTRKSIKNDLAVNLLPVIGVVPYQLMFNRDFHTGGPIVPMGREGLEAQYQYGPQTSTLARIVGEDANLAPAKIDFAVRQMLGGLGNQSVQIVSSAIDYQTKGYVPPIEELPIIGETLARFPSMNVGSIREFYEEGQDVDRVAKTLAHQAKFDPESIGAYIQANKQEVVLIDVYKEARKDIAELRSQIEVVREMPASVITHETRRQVLDQLARTMIQRAEVTNRVVRRVREIQN